MRFSFAGRTENDSAGMAKLALLEAQTRDLLFDKVILDFQSATWFEANLCATLGAICHQISQNLNEIVFENIPPGMLSILEKNRFMSFHGGKDKTDYNGTTVPFQRFRKSEIKSFNEYLSTHLFTISALPKMTSNLKREIQKNILEIFNNSATHGYGELIFSCGQYYPKKERIDFTVANLGRSIRRNVREFLNDKTLPSAEAIEWAVQEGNTTRRGPVPGGIGLFILRNFLRLNKGQVHIYSGDGYWNQDRNGTVKCLNTGNFIRGTIVTVEFNVNDSVNYKLSTE